MCLFRKLAIVFLCGALLIGTMVGTASAEAGDFVFGAGAEADSEDGLSFGLIGDVGLGSDTWLSAGVAHSDVEVPRQQEIDTWYADLGLDHFFDPVGVRVGAAYWGSSELLESSDVRASVYSRGESGTLSIDGEFRDFEFHFAPNDVLRRTTVGFDGTGLGLSGRIKVTDWLNLRAGGMRYEYSRNLTVANTDILDVVTVSRLSVLSSLVDWRASAGIGIDAGARQWQLDISRWRGIVDRSDNRGATVSFLTSMTRQSDIEVSLGYDDSDLYGGVTVLSVFVYFYGGS